MKKSLLLLAMCMTSLSTYAQDDDVYFVPSSKDRTESNDTYTANPGRSSYTPISSDESVFSSSNWANGRGNDGRDVDAYNRRGRNYKGQSADSLGVKQLYDQAYDDGYEDGSYTARIVRFWSPRAGVYVSSPYYFDYYDLCGFYDPFYYGYGSSWSIGWSGWYGWGSWYGWRPYYSWGWNSPWYNPWYDPWYDPWYGPGWGGPHWVWHPTHWLPSNAERGPVGGWVSRGGARGVGGAGLANTTTNSGRGSSSILSGRGFGGRNSVVNNSNNRRTFGNIFRGSNSSTTNNNSKYQGRGFGKSNQNNTQSNRRVFNTDNQNNRSSNRTFGNSNTYSQPSTPSRSSSVGGFGGRGFGGGGGGGRGFGGRR